LWVLVLLSGCSGSQSVLAPAGEQAHGISLLFWLMVAVCGLMYALVLGFLALAVWRGRRRTAAGPGPLDPPRGNLQRALVIWAGLIVAGLTVLIVASFLVDRAIAQARDRQALEVRVTGHQWWWRIEYRDPESGRWIETANELHLPLGRTTRVTLVTADVIHSFWIPTVAQKLDLIPGMSNVLDLTPVRSGWFRGQCAEFCGVQHAHMGFDVKVEPPAAFDRWLARQASPAADPLGTVAARGQQVVISGSCAACHAIRGTAAAGRAAPDLTHVGSRRSIAAGTLRNNRGALQGWVVQPQAHKPGTMMPPTALSPADADAVSRYLIGLQ
jgi:cytochrome c oxidase subunit 2